MQTWITELRQLGPQNLVLAIAGNKVDLDSQRKVGGRGLEYDRRVCHFRQCNCSRHMWYSSHTCTCPGPELVVWCGRSKWIFVLDVVRGQLIVRLIIVFSLAVWLRLVQDRFKLPSAHIICW